MSHIETDGAHIWPPRSSDLRMQALTGAGPEGTKPDDVFDALRALGHTGSLDDMWHKHLVSLGITDTSEPFDVDIAGSPVLELPDAYGTAVLIVTDYVANTGVTQTSSMGPFFNAGSNVLIADHLSDNSLIVDVSTPYDLTTALFTNVDANLYDDARSVVMESNWWRDTGTQLYYCDSFNDEVVSHVTATAFALLNAGMSGQTIYSGVGHDSITDVWNAMMNTSGTKLYIFGSGGGMNWVEQHDLLTPWDLSTASYTAKLQLAANADCAVLNGAGNRILYMSTDRILRSVSGTGDVDNWAQDAETNNLSAVIPGAVSGIIQVEDDGTLNFWTSTSANNIYQLPLI